ncbi:MAG: LapA family protein, partial [Candidatus Spechtbacterales bacterium]
MKTIIFFVTLALATWFAITNAEAVEVDLFLWSFDISLALIVVVSFIFGFSLGALKVIPIWFSKRS